MATPKPRVTFEFEVEKVIGISPDGRFHVQWAPAWVSKFHLVGCEHLIQEFLQKEVEMENRLEKDKTSEPEPDDQFESEDVSTVSEGRKCETSAVAEEKFEYHNTSNFSMGIVVKEESTDTNNNSVPSLVNIKSEESSKEFMNLMDGLLGCSTTKEEPSTLNSSTENIEKPDNPPKNCKISYASDTVKTSSSTGASHFADHIVSVSSKKEGGTSLTLSGSSASKEDSIHPKGLQSTKDTHVLCERNQPTPEEVTPVRACKKSAKGRLHSYVTAHGTKSSVNCDVCKKLLRTPSLLKIHYRIHTDERPFACEICGKAFRRVSHLNDHKRIHTGEKPFPCLDCGKSFSSSSRLGSHRRNIHPHEPDS